MKYCSHCGKPVNNDASFCTNCGASLGSNQTSIQPAHSEPLIKAEHIEEIKKKGSTYFHYVLGTIKKPTSALEENNKWYGYVTCVLLSLFFSLTISRLLNSFITSYFGAYGSGVGADVYFQLFLYYLVLLAIYVGVSYGINVLLLKNRVNFNVFLTRFSGFLSLALCISLAAIVFSLLLGISGLTLILLLLVVCVQLAYLAFTIMLVKPKNNGPVDRFYILVIGWAVIALISYIAVRSAMGSLMEDFMSEFMNGYFW